MAQGVVQEVALRRVQLVEVRAYSLLRRGGASAVCALQQPGHLVALHDRVRDVVEQFRL
jgi:hypothetical protein